MDATPHPAPINLPEAANNGGGKTILEREYTQSVQDFAIQAVPPSAAGGAYPNHPFATRWAERRRRIDIRNIIVEFIVTANLAPLFRRIFFSFLEG
jgi:hypothetical protein